MAPADFTALRELLAGRRLLVEQMLALTTALTRALEAEEYDELAALLEERQRHIKGLDSISAQIGLAWLAAGTGMPGEGREFLGEEDAAVSRLARELVAADKSLGVRMRGALAAVRQGLAEANVYKKGFCAYGELRQVPEGSVLNEKK